MRTLMLNQADVLHRVAEMERQVSAAIATMRTQIDAVMAEGIPLPAAGTGRGLTQAETGSTTDLPFAAVGGVGIPVQATTTLVMTWLSFGLVVRATITVGKGYDQRLYAHSDGALKVAGALVLQGFSFVLLNLPAGALSAVFFESTAIGLAGGGLLPLMNKVYSGPAVLAVAATKLAVLGRVLQAAGHHIAGHPGGCPRQRRARGASGRWWRRSTPSVPSTPSTRSTGIATRAVTPAVPRGSATIRPCSWA